MWTRKELKKRAAQALKVNYWKAVLVSGIFYMLLCGGSGNSVHINLVNIVPMNFNFNNSAASPDRLYLGTVLLTVVAVLAVLIKFFVINPLHVGIVRFELNALNSEGKVSDIGYGFGSSYLRNVKTMFICGIYILIGFILFIIPGIIMAYQLMMVPYILAENPDIDRKEAFELSSKYMEGNKWKTFVLELSFIFWHMLGSVTLGIAELFYVGPYVRLTYAALYEAIKK